MKKIYLIGSLANQSIIDLGIKIRGLGYDVFDDWISAGEFADEYFQSYRLKRGMNYREALNSHAAKHIFSFDKEHLDGCDIAILVMPAGKSAHLELGYAIGQGKKGYIYFDKEPDRFDQMTAFAEILLNEDELIEKLKDDQS